MKMGAGAPILDRHQARQNIDFFNTIRTLLPFGAYQPMSALLSTAFILFDDTSENK